jgi:hypothetical protein
MIRIPEGMRKPFAEALKVLGPPRKSGTRQQNEWHLFRLTLHGFRFSDKQIGDFEGVTSEAINRWRRDNGLPSNSVCNGISKFQAIHLLDCLQRGGPVAKAANAVGLKVPTARRFLKRIGVEGAPDASSRSLAIRSALTKLLDQSQSIDLISKHDNSGCN